MWSLFISETSGNILKMVQCGHYEWQCKRRYILPMFTGRIRHRPSIRASWFCVDEPGSLAPVHTTREHGGVRSVAGERSPSIRVSRMTHVFTGRVDGPRVRPVTQVACTDPETNRKTCTTYLMVTLLVTLMDYDWRVRST